VVDLVPAVGVKCVPTEFSPRQSTSDSFLFLLQLSTEQRKPWQACLPEPTLTTPAETKKLPDFTTPEDFLFRTPPYDVVQLSEENMRGMFGPELRLDGYCPYCRKVRTFSRTTGGGKSNEWFSKYGPSHKLSTLGALTIQCARYDVHDLSFDYHLRAGQLQKTGQWPSFADIALDESKDYSKLLAKEDAAEFHRAIGLAAHNVGIGSYVYLRRIFERLVTQRFEEFKAGEGWADGDFYGVRMDDRVKLLKDHLPPFLVKNARIYSILSLGIHELKEADCLAFFKVLRQSLVLILEEDKKKREELEMQQELQKAIAGFMPKT
jgi:hypothetical protein